MGCCKWLIVCSMKRLAEEILAKIDAEIRLRDCDVDSAMDNALYMVRFIAPMYEQLREMSRKFLASISISVRCTI